MRLTPKPPRRRRVAEHGLTPGVWHPELVGRIRNYPKTAEAYAERIARLKSLTDKARAEGTLTRRGVPDGWRGRKADLETLRRNSVTVAERLVASVSPAPATLDDERAELAMTYALSVVLNPSVVTSVRLQVAKIILPFLLAPPARKAALAAVGDPVALLEAFARATCSEH